MISKSTHDMGLGNDGVDDPTAEALSVAATYQRRFPDVDVEGIAALFSLNLTVTAATQLADQFFGRFGHGLNTARYSLLRALYLAEDKQRPLNEVARELGVTSQNVTYLLVTLAKEGLVERIASETDRRVFHAHLTPAGEELCAVLLPATVQFLEALAAPFSTEEKINLAALLGRLRQHVLGQFDSTND